MQSIRPKKVAPSVAAQRFRLRSRQDLRPTAGSKLVINAGTVRLLGPESLLEKGSTTVTDADGETNGSLYTAIYVKKDGEWKINQLIESPLPVLTPNEHLQELGWLVGDWEETDQTDDLSIHGAYTWARGGSFLTRNVTVKRAGTMTLEGWQIIGWDPLEERLRSWTFDDAGVTLKDISLARVIAGYSVRPASRPTVAGQAPTIRSPRSAWIASPGNSNNRTLDGDPQPSIGQIEINRVKGE